MRTADFQMTRGILQILKNDGNEDDIIAFFADKNLPVDDITAHTLAQEIMKKPPLEGYLTISNALQWRLQYTRVIEQAGKVRYPIDSAAHKLTKLGESPRIGFQALSALARWLGSRDERSAGVDLEEAAQRTAGPRRDAAGTNGPASDARSRGCKGGVP